MKTFDEVTQLLEKSIEDHNLVKFQNALKYYEGSIYSRVGFAGPLFFAVECDFTEGVEFLINNYYGDLLLGFNEIDRLWRTALFGYPKKGKSIVMVLLEYNLLPSKSFLASLSSEIRNEKEQTRDNIISYLKKNMPDVEIYACCQDTDQISISKKV